MKRLINFLLTAPEYNLKIGFSSSLLVCLSWGFCSVSLAQPGQVKANGITIAYESFGAVNRPAILLIAGTNAQLTMWPRPFCDQLASRGYRVIRFDNRDVGLLTRLEQAGPPDWAAISKAMLEQKTPPLPYSLDDMASDAVGLLKALQINKAHIVGASMGGMIAQRVAYNHPQYTLSLASLMSGRGKPVFPLLAKPTLFAQLPPPGPATDTSGYIERETQSYIVLTGPVYKSDRARVQERVRADVRRGYYPDGAARHQAASLVGFYTGREAALKTIKVPTVVIHGSEDPLVTVDAGRDIAATIPGAQFERVDGMGHDLPDAVLNKLATLIVNNAAKAGQKKTFFVN